MNFFITSEITNNNIHITIYCATDAFANYLHVITSGIGASRTEMGCVPVPISSSIGDCQHRHDLSRSIVYHQKTLR